MGKRVHGRTVHEVRETLFRAGFMPARITQLETPGGRSPVHSPGFKVEKHNDGKSVRLFHVMAPARAEARSRVTMPSQEGAHMQKLIAYGATLEQQGFTRIAVNCRGRSGSYSLWRR